MHSEKIRGLLNTGISGLKKSLSHLENLKTDTGTYLFPKSYLKEKTNSYFITGAHMGLGENRHKKIAYEIESNFWMLKIKKNIGILG